MIEAMQGPGPQTSQVDWEQVQRDLAPIRSDRSEATLKRKSRDYYWFSPILKSALDGVRADIVVMPETSDELAAVARYCVRHRLPLTVRGAGTGNYGQAMPLRGGVLIDTLGLDRVLWIKDNMVRAQAGAKLHNLEMAANTHGLELRFFPSTWRTATVGGFVAGGSTGCGAINYGTLHGRGNVTGIKVLTMEDEPRIIELAGDEVQAVIHAYGVNGIILEVELALAPIGSWHDHIVAMPDLRSALLLLDKIAHDDAIRKRELALHDAPTAQFLKPIEYLDAGRSPLLMIMVANETLPAFRAAVAAAGGAIIYERDPDQKPSRVPAIHELCWNHTTMHAIAQDRTMSYLQCAFPADYIPVVEVLVDQLGEELPMHLEMACIDGAVVCLGLPLLRFTTSARLAEIHEILRGHGCTIFSPHTYVLENGGLQVVDPVQLAFRKQSDPLGLLNPGKMPGWDAPAG